MQHKFQKATCAAETCEPSLQETHIRFENGNDALKKKQTTYMLCLIKQDAPKSSG